MLKRFDLNFTPFFYPLSITDALTGKYPNVQQWSDLISGQISADPRQICIYKNNTVDIKTFDLTLPVDQVVLNTEELATDNFGLVQFQIKKSGNFVGAGELKNVRVAPLLFLNSQKKFAIPPRQVLNLFETSPFIAAYSNNYTLFLSLKYSQKINSNEQIILTSDTDPEIHMFKVEIGQDLISVFFDTQEFRFLRNPDLSSDLLTISFIDIQTQVPKISIFHFSKQILCLELSSTRKFHYIKTPFSFANETNATLVTLEEFSLFTEQPSSGCSKPANFLYWKILQNSDRLAAVIDRYDWSGQPLNTTEIQLESGTNPASTFILAENRRLNFFEYIFELKNFDKPGARLIIAEQELEIRPTQIILTASNREIFSIDSSNQQSPSLNRFSLRVCFRGQNTTCKSHYYSKIILWINETEQIFLPLKNYLVNENTNITFANNSDYTLFIKNIKIF